MVRRRPRVDPVLAVQGFKSVRDDVSISLRPLTLICGNNSSGKSAIFQPLLLIKQTLEAPYDPGPLLLDGPDVSLSRFRDALWHGRQRTDIASEFSVGYDSGAEYARLTFAVGETGGVDLKEVRYRPPVNGSPEPQREITLRPGVSQDDMWAATPPRLRTMFGKAERGLNLTLRRRRCFYEVLPDLGDEAAEAAGPSLTEFRFIRELATNLIHLPGLRDNPSRFYPATQVGTQFPGPFQPYTASVIAAWHDDGDPRLGELGQQLSELGLTWKAIARRLDDTRVELRVGRLPKPQQGGAQDLVNIADVGLGISQSLPILVALLVASPGQVVYLEQPEIHLHPRAQVALSKLLVEASCRGVMIVCETHSYLLLRAIQEWSAREPGVHELVKAHWFSRDRNGVTHVDSTDLDRQGAFGDWPVDFADVELEVEDRYLSAAMNAVG